MTSIDIPRSSNSSNDDSLINAQPCGQDRLLYTYVQLLNDIVSIREDMRHCFDEGFIHLAKSKTLMGFANLEFEQLTTESTESAVTMEVDPKGAESSSVELSPQVDQNILRHVLSKASFLAPSSLRNTQQCFRRICELSADLHNAYSRLSCVSDAFRGQPCNCDHDFCHRLKIES